MSKLFGPPLDWLLDDEADVGDEWVVEPPTPATAPQSLSLAEALPVVLGRLPGLDDYTAGKVLHAIQAASKPGADLEKIERDLVQWLGERSATPPASPPEKRTGTSG